MNSLLTFAFENKTSVVRINSNIILEVKGLSFRMICELSEKHLKSMNNMIKDFKQSDLSTYKDFFDDLILKCLTQNIDIDTLNMHVKSAGKLKLLKAIYNLSIFDDAFLKKYKMKIKSAGNTASGGAVAVAEKKFRKEAIEKRAKALGFSSTIEDMILVCEYLLSRNVSNAYDLSLKSLFNKYKVHCDIENRESTRLINIIASILYMHHGDNDKYNELTENLSEI